MSAGDRTASGLVPAGDRHAPGRRRGDTNACRPAPGVLFTAALALLLAGVTPMTAEATQHRRPFGPNLRITAGYDNNGNAGGCTDSQCGGNCYDTHTGTDFWLGMYTEVVASASGTVTQAVGGCPDWGYYCSPCGGYCGNHVRVRHDDGTLTLYCHLADGSISVGVGQHVDCGQRLGLSATSGCSTGPHLHYGWQPGGGAALDPYSGPCSNGGGAWVDQGNFGMSPGTDCENRCECNPGESQTEGCGRCGRHSRSCGGDCHWGGWGACEGEGVCGVGEQQSEPCCDCGTRTRTCGGNCQWEDFGGCGGPDPAGPPPCDTGKPGDCAAGAVRCVAGCLTCTDTVEPQPEICDDRDNDCDGPVDEDVPALGDRPPPHLAAQLEDLSAPGALRPGERAEVWATFRNVGLDVWPAGQGVLGVDPDGTALDSPLRDPAAWAAYDTPAMLSEAVAPGDSTTVVFPVLMPADVAAGDDLSTRFGLVVHGDAVRCPEPGFEVAPAALLTGESPPGWSQQTDAGLGTATGPVGVGPGGTAPAADGAASGGGLHPDARQARECAVVAAAGCGSAPAAPPSRLTR